MLDGFYPINNQILKMYSEGKKVESEFGLYIASKENLQRIYMTLPRGQFYITINQVSKDLNISFSKAQRIITSFKEKGIIKLIHKYEKWEKRPSIWQVQSTVESDNRSDTRIDSQSDNQKPSKINALNGVIDNQSDTQSSNQNDNPKKENLKENLNKDIYIQIIKYLNEKAGTNYRSTTKSTQRLINARLKHYSLDDFKNVIDKKCIEWINTEFEKYLTPTTLFAETNFEKYSNQKIKPVTTKEVQRVNRWAGRELPDS